MKNELIISLTGSVTKNNLPEFKDEALAMIKAADIPLVSDADFLQAEQTIKDCKGAEDAIDLAKHNALRDTADIAALFESLDEVSNELRNTRLSLSKQVKSEKESRKTEIIDSRCEELERIITKTGLPYSIIHVERSVFIDAIKGKRSLEKMEEALDEALAAANIDVIQVSKMADHVRATVKAANRDSLFPDIENLLTK